MFINKIYDVIPYADILCVFCLSYMCAYIIAVCVCIRACVNVYRKLNEVGYLPYPPVWYCYFFCTVWSFWGTVAFAKKRKEDPLQPVRCNIMCSSIVCKINTYKYYIENHR